MEEAIDSTPLPNGHEGVSRRTVLAGMGGAVLATALAAPKASEAQTAQTRFAIVGDFGMAGTPAQNVATLVESWNPEFIVTTGDNNYEKGAAATIDINVGQYYHDYIYPYRGSYGAGAATNRFFPILGNHDWYTWGAKPYLDYFTLPGNERYYDTVWGPVHLFALDSDTHEPDGYTADSIQAAWLKSRLAASTAKWKLVFCHHSPYSSGKYERSTPYMQWPFEAWGASAVFSGHSHQYERLSIGGIPFFVNGLGGADIGSLDVGVPGSQIRYNSDYGAMLAVATTDGLTLQFITRAGATIDTYTIGAPPPPPPGPVPPAPKDFDAHEVSSSQVDTWWKDTSTLEKGFLIEVAPYGGAFAEVARVPANTVRYSVKGLKGKTTYSFRAAAFNDSGVSPYSRIVTKRTK